MKDEIKVLITAFALVVGAVVVMLLIIKATLVMVPCEHNVHVQLDDLRRRVETLEKRNEARRTDSYTEGIWLRYDGLSAE